MEIKINSLQKSKKEIIVSLNQKDLLPFKEEALKELNKDLQINGYRLGKAPLSIAENHLSSLKVYERMTSLAIDQIYPKIIKDKKIQAIGYPSINITKIVPNQEVEFKAEVAIIPQVELPNYQEIAQKIPKNKKESLTIEEKEIEQALLWLQDSRANLEQVSRSAEKEDIVTIDYQIKEDKKLIENGEDKNYSFILGKGSFLPGFEDNIIGMKTGEEKKFELIVPKDWPQKNLQNKKLNINVSLKEIKTKKLPILNDEFAQSIGKFKTLEDLKKNIKEGLLLEKKQKETERWRLEALEKIIAETKIDLPEILVQNEIEKMVEELKAQLEKMQLPFDKYLEQIKKSEEDLKKEFKELAEKRVSSALVLREIASIEKIEASEKEIEKKINEILSQIPETEKKEKINQDNLKEFALGIIRNEKVFEILEGTQKKDTQDKNN
ncbi:MAG: trigger factor [Candidatus Pacebacteria bacterium]|jgi:trigger factor|nr:trigger factor [Candidatus Paceibacterota bacterium]